MLPTSRLPGRAVVFLAAFALIATSCVAIVLPQPGQTVSLPYTIRGVAVQDDSVTAVKLRIFDDNNGQQWNPTTGQWQSTYVDFNATLANPGANATVWTYAFNPGGNAGSGFYSVEARSFHFGQGSDKVSTRFTTGGAAPPPPPPPPPPNGGRCGGGEFTIDENRAGIRDTDGTWFLPRGINLAAGQHFDGAFFENNSAAQITAADVAVMRDNWQFNSIRLNVNSQAGPQVFEDPVVHRVIGLFTDAGMVVMVTNHNLTGQDPTVAQRNDQAQKFGTMAARYADNPCVWFNPYNEPGGSPTSTYNYNDGDVTDDDAWIDWHVPVIDAIRAESDAVIVLNESHWGQGRARGAYTPNHSTVLTYGQQVNQMYDNIMYTVHFYERWDGSTQDIQSYLQSANNKGLAIAVGEIGGHHTLGGSRPTSRWTTVQAVYNLAPAGVGLYAWHADARHSSGMAMGPHPTGGGGRTLVWDITERSQTDATGTKQWDWNHNPPAPVPS